MMTPTEIYERLALRVEYDKNDDRVRISKELARALLSMASKYAVEAMDKCNRRERGY